MSETIVVTGPNANIEGFDGLVVLQSDPTEFVAIEGFNGIVIVQVTYP